jgi:hypothetical protein
MRLRTPGPLLLATLLGGCGSSSGVSVRCPSAAAVTEPPAPGASAGVARFAADRGRVDPGGAVDFTASVHGPAKYRADCAGPLQLIVSDQADIHVYSAAPPAVHGVPCGAVSLPGGRSAEYQLTWRIDATLPAGLYDATLVLGDQPPTTLQVRLGRPAGAGCR